MKFEGKFEAAKAVDPSASHSHANGHIDSASVHAPSDAIIVSDAHLLFGGEYTRSGVDLILSNENERLVLEGYFKGEKHAALASPDGAHLTGDIVNALSGGHVDYAQADGAASAAKVIGHVTKLIGTATAIRNGVTIILNQGDNVNKGDVLQSGSDSTVGVTFIDGTVFGLSSNARMVLNEMIYDPNGSNNSSLLSLVKGTISFVAGETAKHGDMKVDTPAATMGIRGTAVLVQIDFDVPGQGDVPDARFDVLVEPDGTTGSYILYDKNTLDPIATVNKAGAHVKISHGVVSQVSSELSSDVQKLITDVFSLKFTSLDPNPKSLDHFTDTIIPQSFAPKFVDNRVVAIPVFVNLNTDAHQLVNAPPPSNPVPHIPLAPAVATTNTAITEISGVTGSNAIDTAIGTIKFVDVNAGDLPTVSASFTSFTYQNAKHVDITSSLTQQQLADIKAVEAQLSLVASAGNDNNGSATWTYSIADKAFDFLAAGETLTLTYTAQVDSNFAQDDLKGYATFTITITGTNDAPVITSSAPAIQFAGGITTPGGYLISPEATHGTLSFTDVDLTDTHTVTTALTSAVFSGPGALTVTKVPPGPLQLFETALSAVIATDSTGTGFGTINWNLANLPVYLADFIPNGETLALTYTITVTDSQGATSSQNIVVDITGTDTPAVVWIATTTPNGAPGGLWSDVSNWETGTVPTATDDAIIITNQLIGLTPSYPVTINAPAVAKTVTLNDFSDLGNAHPELINLSTLTVGSTFTLGADSTLNNSGSVTIGGALEVLNTSVLQNSGQITLQGGGDFRDQSTVTNSGTIEVSGGTLNIDVNVDNTGGHLTIDAGGKVALAGATINHGVVTNAGELDLNGNAVLSNGSLGNTGAIVVFTPANALFNTNFSSTLTLTYNGNVGITGQINVSGSGNALDNESVGNNGTITIYSAASLTLDDTTITGGAIIDSGTINVDAADKLTVSGVTLWGGAITDAGTVEISGSGSIDNDSFSNNQLTVDAGQILTLDGTTVTGGTVTDSGTVHVDATNRLTLSGVALSGGAITNAGTVEISGSSAIDNDSFSNAQLTVDAGQVLTLDGTTVTGGTVTDSGTVHVDATNKLTLSGVALSGGAITNAGTVEISGSSAIDNDSFSNAQLTVDAGQVLTLDGTTVTGGTITDSGTVHVNASEKLTLSGVALSGGAITNAGTVEISGSGSIDSDSFGNAQLTIDAGQILTLDGTTVTGGTITDSGTVHVDASDKLTLSGVALSGGAITDAGTVEISGSGSVDNDSFSNTQLTVDAGQILTLNGTTISGGTITNAGTVEISGSGSIDNDSFGNTQLTVDAGQVLTLDGTTVTGGTITDNGTVHVDATDKLTLSGVALSGGAITNAGTVEISGSGSIDSDSFGNNQLTVDASQVLTLDGTTVTGGTITDNGTIHVDASDKLTLSGVTLSGGAITNAGTVEISGSGSIDNDSFSNAQLTVDAGQVLTLDGTTVTGGAITDTGTIHIDSGDKLTLSGVALSGGAITNAGTIEISGSGSIDNDSFGNAQLTVDAGQVLTLDGTTVTGGAITDAGTVEISGSGSIDNDSFGNAQLTVDAGQILTLDGTTVTGGAITDNGTVHVDASDKLTLSGVALSGGAITNAGTIEISGSSSVDNDSFGNAQLTIDAGQILTLDGTTVTGGTITDNGTVHVDASEKLTLSGVALSGGAITNAGTVEISGSGSIDSDSFGNAQLTIDAGQILTLDGTTVTGGTVTNNGTVHVDASDKLTLSGVALSGGAITDAGTVEISGSGSIDSDSFGNTQLTVDAGQVLTLDGTTVTGGTITDNGTVHVDASDKLTLSGVALSGGAITNAGAVEIGGSGSIDNDTFGNTQLTVDAGQVLTLDGTTVTGGTVTDSGTVHVDASDQLTLSGVALSGGAITNAGTVEIGGSGSIDNDTFGNAQLTIDVGQVLTLDGTTVTGGTITDNGTVHVDASDKLTLSGVALSGGAITDAGTVEISGSGSIDNDGFGNTQLTVDAGQVLTLDGTTVTGGTVTDSGTVHVDASDKLTLSGVALSGGAITNAGTVEIGGSGSIDNDTFGNAQLTIDVGQVLTLDGTTVTGGTITDNGTVHVDASDKLTLSGVALSGGAITDAGTVEIGGSGSIDNDSFGNAQLTVDASQILTLDGTTVTGGAITDTGTIHIDSGDVLTLSGVALSGGAITDAGTVEIGGSGSIDNDSFGNAQLTVDASQILTLDGTTVTGGTITDNGTIHVDASDKLTLSGVTLSGGAITNAGTVEISGSGSIDSDSFSNAQLTVDAGQVLTLDGTTVTGGAITDTGTIHIDSGDVLTLSGVALSGGAITDAGTVEISGSGSINNDSFGNAQLTVDASQVLTLDGTTVTGGTVTNSGTIHVDTSDTLTLSGVTLSGGAITNAGTIQVSGDLALSSSGTLSLQGAGTLQLSGGEISATGTNGGATLDNYSTISGFGQIGIGNPNVLNVDNEAGGTIEASGGTLKIEIHSGLTNAGTLEAASGATLQINIGTIDNTGNINIDGTLALDQPHTYGTTLTLNDTGTVTLNGGEIRSIVSAVETLENHGNTISGTGQIGDGTTNYLTLDNAVGTVEATGGTLTLETGNTITNAGTLEAVSGGTLQIDDSVSNTGLIEADGGTVVVASTAAVTGNGSASISGGGTLEIAGSDTQGVTFSGAGTLQLDASSDFTGTISGFGGASDIIQLANTTVTSAYFEGATLYVNDQPTSFQFAGVPAGDTIAFKADASGTELELLPQVLAVGSPSAAVGVEGTPIGLGFSDTVTGATLSHFVISGIPDGAIITDGTPGHSYTSGSANGSVDVASWNLSALTITSTNDANFQLSALVTAVDSNGFNYTLPEVQTVTVNPTASTLTWSPAVSGIEGQIALGNLIDTVTGLPGDTNSVNTLTISGVPDGAVLSDGTNSITSDGSTPISVKGWTLTSLTVDTSHATVPDGNFTLTATATEVDGQTNLSTTTTSTEAVTVTPEAPAVTPVAETGVEGTAIALDLGTTVNGLTGDSNSLASLVVSAIPVGAVLSDDQGHSFTAGVGTQQVDIHGWDLSHLTITPTNAANFSLTVAATTQDATGDLSTTTTSTEAITVTPQAPDVTPVAETGVEGTAIALDLGTTVNGLTGDSNSLASLVVGAIPVGAVLSDDQGHSFTAVTGTQQVDIHGWDLSHLTITPTNAANFSLTVAATTQDATGDLSTTTTSTEAITVNPQAPDVTPVAETGVEGTAIALDLGTTVNGLTGDSNSLASLVVGAIPVGAVLSDDQGHSFTAVTGTQQVDIHGWDLSHLTITPTNAANFSLTVAATTQDATGDLSTTTTSTEAITVNPQAPDVTPVAETGVEGTAIALDLGTTVNGLTGDSNSLASLVVGAIPVGAVLSDDQGHSFTAGVGTQQVDIHGWDLSHLTITPTNAANFSLTVAATTQDATGDLSTTTTSTEAITVNPQAPDVTPVAETGADGAAIALNLGTTVNGLNGETNTLSSLVVSAIPVGAVLSDGTPADTFTASAGHQQIDIHGWNLSNLTITSANDASFSLTVAATAADAEGNSSTTTTSTEAVTLTQVAPMAFNESYSVLGTAPSIGSTITLGASAPAGDTFAVTSVTYGGIPVVFNQTDGAFEAQGSHGELYVYPAAGTSVTAGALPGTSHAGDLVLVVDPTASDPVHSLAPGATLTDTFGYTITDSVTGLSSTATATFTYADSNIFTGASGGDWNDAGNWMFGVPDVSFSLPVYVGSDKHVDVSSTVSLASDLYNNGEIDVAAGGILNFNGVTLHGGGAIVLSGGEIIPPAGATTSHTLENADNTISGAGTIGAGDGYLHLQNDAMGTINANDVNGGTLTLHMGDTVTNGGLLEATGGGTLHIDDAVSNSGVIEANGGTVVVASGATITGDPTVFITNNGTAEFVGSSTQSLALNAEFIDAGTLKLDQPQEYNGIISGVAANNGVIDLGGFAANDVVQASTAGHYNAAANTTSLVVTDETSHVSTTLTLAGDYSASNWSATSDGSGTQVVDMTAPLSIGSGQTVELSNPGAPGEGVAFQGSTGSLILDQPSSFTGLISGFTGTQPDAAHSDAIDLVGINDASLQESFNSTTGTMTLTDGTDSATLHFSGTYVAANFSFADDGNGGTIVYDPPVAPSAAPTPAPTPAPSVTVASVVTAVNHGFEFNFPNPTHDATTDFHPPANSNQPSPAAWAALTGPHDDTHSNPVAPVDVHDALIKANIIQAQHHADFHFG